MQDQRTGLHLAGLVQSRRSRSSGTIVNVYYAPDAGLDDDGGAWVTCCEDHNQLANHLTRKRAEFFAPYPGNWCSVCSGIDKEDT